MQNFGITNTQSNMIDHTNMKIYIVPKKGVRNIGAVDSLYLRRIKYIKILKNKTKNKFKDSQSKPFMF